jgi:hypothetical protein
MFFALDSAPPVVNSAPTIAVPALSHFTSLITAAGALGTAAYGLVDCTKAFGGGVSLCGLAYIRKSLTPFLPDTTIGTPTSELSRDKVLETRKSNWINGMASSDQQAIAKSLIKLRIDVQSAPGFAQKTGVDPAVLQAVIDKMSTGTALTPAETDTYGRFDLVLTTMIGQAYQRADQQYRNNAKLLAIPFSVALALVAAHLLNNPLGPAFLIGLVATPLAPVAKDISSAVQTAVQALQARNS